MEEASGDSPKVDIQIPLVFVILPPQLTEKDGRRENSDSFEAQEPAGSD